MAAKKKEAPVITEVCVLKQEDGWWWSARSANGKEVASSGEGYVNRGYAYRVAKTLYPGIPVLAG